LTFQYLFFYNINKLLAGEESSLAPLPFLNLGASTASIFIFPIAVQIKNGVFPQSSTNRVFNFASWVTFRLLLSTVLFVCRFDDLFCLFLDMFVLVQMGNTLLQPVRHRFSHEIMIEEFSHPHCVVLLVGRFPEAMIFPLVLEHDHRFFQASEGVEVLNSLVPVYCSVFVIVEDNKRSCDVFGKINRRISCVSLNVFPVTAFKSSLAALEDRLIGRA